MFYNYVKKILVNILGTAPGRISDHSGWKMFSGDITIFTVY